MIGLARLAPLAAMVVLLTTGCGAGDHAPATSGVVAVTVFGRGCPAQQVGFACGRPFQGEIEFLAGSRLVARAHTDGRGRAWAKLAPGGYTLIAVGLENLPGRQRFRVVAGRVRHLRFVIANGIF